MSPGLSPRGTGKPRVHCSVTGFHRAHYSALDCLRVQNVCIYEMRVRSDLHMTSQSDNDVVMKMLFCPTCTVGTNFFHGLPLAISLCGPERTILQMHRLKATNKRATFLEILLFPSNSESAIVFRVLCSYLL